jgi:hypothetical protein
MRLGKRERRALRAHLESLSRLERVAFEATLSPSTLRELGLGPAQRLTGFKKTHKPTKEETAHQNAERLFRECMPTRTDGDTKFSLQREATNARRLSGRRVGLVGAAERK